jgi:hypothetical protein
MAKRDPAEVQPDEPLAPELEATWLQEGDGQLRFLVHLVNGTDTEIGITLTVGGLLISGYLASGHRYFEDFADTITAGYARGNADADEASLTEMREGFALPGKSIGGAAREGKLGRAPRFIHVRKVHYFLPGAAPIPTNVEEQSWWRGRMDRVDGYQLGALAEEDE